MTTENKDYMMGFITSIKNIIIVIAITFLLYKTDHWWGLFLILGMSSFKMGKDNQKENKQ